MSDSKKKWEENRSDEYKTSEEIKKDYLRGLEFIYNKLENNTTSTEGKKETEGKLNYELDWDFIKAMAERMASNKDKYEPYNWKKPIEIEEIKQALFRHTLDVMKGNYEDDGRKLGHLEAIAINCMILNFHLKELEKDDFSSDFIIK